MQSDVNSPELCPTEAEKAPAFQWLQWLSIVGLIYLLLVSVSLISAGFKISVGEEAKALFAFASNPITGLVIGTITTALIQSSSTVTAIIVGLVAGGLPVQIAIPMVMGANIGTTITNTIVSLGHVRRGDEFRRAFSAATVHDFFNLVTVIIFLPLEILFGLLEKLGAFLASHMVGGESISMSGLNFVKPLVKPPVNELKSLLEFLPSSAAGVALIVVGVVLIFLSITLVGKFLKRLMVGRAKRILHYTIGRGPLTGISSGTLITVLVQSSSTTTSLVVPLAGSGIFNIRQIYPFTLGANIGTCITGLLAATAVTGGNAVFALQIALVHLCYNLLGVIVVYGIPFLREIPVRAAEKLALAAERNKLNIVAYICVVFLIGPGVMILGSKTFGL